MISFVVYLKEEEKYPDVLYSRKEESDKASALRSAVAQEFADYIIDGDREDQPFVYITLVPIREKDSAITAASIVSSDLCFKNEIREELIAFIKSY